MASVTFHGTKEELKGVLYGIPAALAGTGPDKLGIVPALLTRAGNAVLSKIQGDFLTKSRGGTGEDGIKWLPLSPATIARRRTGPADKAALRARTEKLPLYEKQRTQLEYKERLASLRLSGIPEKQAKSLARAQAFNTARGRGNEIPKRQDILGSREVDILRDTSRLLNSLVPGYYAQPSGVADQVFRVEPGRIVVGTNVEYASTHQHGAGRVPARPLWPTDSLPDSWAEALGLALQRGIQEAIVANLSRAA